MLDRTPKPCQNSRQKGRGKMERNLANRTLADTQQRSRFINAARELGCDDDAASFEAKLGKIAKAKTAPKRDSREPRVSKTQILGFWR